VPRLVFLKSARLDLADILEYITRESGSVRIGRTLCDNFGGDVVSFLPFPAHWGAHGRN